MLNTIVVHFDSDSDKYFFSTSHTQKGLSENWVPCTFYLGNSYQSVEDIKRIQLYDKVEIPNPNMDYWSEYSSFPIFDITSMSDLEIILRETSQEYLGY